MGLLVALSIPVHDTAPHTDHRERPTGMAAAKEDVFGGISFVRNTSYKLPRGCEWSDEA